MAPSLMSRVYVWEVDLSGLQDDLTAMEKASASADRVTRYNPTVLGAAVIPGDRSMTVKVHIQGRDQWWIKKVAPNAIVAILAQSRIPFASAKLVDVNRTEDLRSTRPRASDGRHNPIPEDQDIDHCDMMECETV